MASKDLEMAGSIRSRIGENGVESVHNEKRHHPLNLEQNEDMESPVLAREQNDDEWSSSNRSSRRQEDGEEWLPLPGPRNGRWQHSAFHNITAMVGAGVLGMPSAMAFLGWGPGILALGVSWVITLYTLWQMVQMHEINPEKRLDQYHELGQQAFGRKRGLWIVLPAQLTVQVVLDIVYLVTGGQCLRRFYELVKGCNIYRDNGCIDSHLCGDIGPAVWTVIFAAPQFILAQLPNLSSISGLSLAAAVMSFSYSTIAWVDTVGHHDSHAPYGRPRYIARCSPSVTLSRPADSPLPGPADSPLSGPADRTWRLSNLLFAFGVMKSLGIVGFAFGGHNVALEIQATLQSTSAKPSKIPMWKGVKLAYVVIALCYFPVAIAGYWAFGNEISENILFSLKKPTGLIAAANLMVVIHVMGSYQLYAMPVFDLLETTITVKLNMARTHFLQLLVRCSYVLFTGFVACALPFFGDLLGLFGGLAIIPTTYFLPCIIWLKLFSPKRFGVSWTINWACIVIGVLWAITATIGGLFYIVLQFTNYQFFK